MSGLTLPPVAGGGPERITAADLFADVGGDQ